MKILTITSIALVCIWTGNWCEAADGPEKSLSALGAEAFSKKEVARSQIATEAIEASVSALVDRNMKMLQSGNLEQQKIAARLLGVFRERKAIDLLIQNITLEEFWSDGSSAKGQENVGDLPAYMALKSIGGKEVLTAAERHKKGKEDDSKERKLLERLIVDHAE